jgi:pimeloyl-ACP methyl ester carboxylesterase
VRVRLTRGRMNVVTAGVGPPVVLLHGWPGFSFDYPKVVPLLAPTARVVAPDFLGFGDSDSPAGNPAVVADEEAYARDVVELLDALGLERPVVAGHDIGSAVAAALARLAPERVGGLVLMNPTHPFIGPKRDAPDAQREGWYQHFHLLPLAEELLDGDRRAVELYLRHFYAHWAGEEEIEPEELARVVEVYARPGRFTASLAWYRARAVRRRRPERLAPVGVRTIALWGDRDPMRPLEHRAGFKLAFPRSQSRVLAGVGHFVPTEAPEAVRASVRELSEARKDLIELEEAHHG